MSRSTQAELAERSEAAAFLLASGVPRTLAVSELAARFSVSRRTAQRYVDAGAQQLAAEIGSPDLTAALQESVERLRRLAHACESSGNLSAAVGAEKAAAGAITSLARLQALAVGHTVAMVESLEAPVSEHKRRKYRQSVERFTAMPF